MRHRIVRALAFFRKELAEVVRQPKLVATLVLGPFVILALFGAGYRSDAAPLRTVVVAAPDHPLLDGLDEIIAEAREDIDFLGRVTDEDAALGQLRRGEADLVVVAPEDPEATIRAGDRADFRVVHDELDPFSRTSLVLVAGAAVDELNRAVLEEFAAYSQEESERLDAALPAARLATDAIEEALARGDRAGAERHLARLEANVRVLDAGYRPSAEILAGGEERSAIASALDRMRRAADALADPEADFTQRAAAVAAVEEDLITFEAELATFQRIAPSVLVRPFGQNTDALFPFDADLTAYYAPGVIVLLLQHLAITFAALSLVRERTLGTTELFRAAPLTAGETIAGKTLGYLVMGAAIAAGLTGLMLAGFDVPMRGAWAEYATVTALVLAASIGLGFVISAVAETDSQAVQYSMIALLAAIFFSGFFLTLDRLHPAVQAVAMLIPVSYGIAGLQDVMFRGAGLDFDLVAQLGAYVVVAFGAAWVLLRRRFATS